LTAEPSIAPFAELAFAFAVARADTDEAVISPLKRERLPTSAEALAVATVPLSAETLALFDGLARTEPSPG
jgi:hypothetical protein